jgi:lauroyl/myristoyl acyltransferase
MSLPGVALALVRALPDRPAALLSRAIVLLYLALRPAYRQEIRRNLRIIMGKESRWFWVRNGWRLGSNLAAMARVGSRTGDALVDRAMVCGENLTYQVLERELHATMASFHFGLWEYLPQVFSRSGCRVTLAVGEQRDRALGRQLSSLRRSGGVSMARGIRQTIRAGGEPSITGFMLDNTSQGTQVWTECDGVKLRLPDIGFKLAAREGRRLVPAFARLQNGRVRVDVYPPGDEHAAACALLEQVRQHPEEWVWWGKAGAISG